MEYSISSDGNKRHLNLNGRLTFSDHEAFRKITNSLKEPGPKNCLVNLSRLEFIDSAGLGLLLLVNEAAKENSVSVTLAGACGQVKKLLDITKFNEIIPIE